MGLPLSTMTMKGHGLLQDRERERRMKNEML